MEAAYLAIDVESGGDTFSSDLLAVGMCLGTAREGVIEKKVWCLKESVPIEQRCFEEFWSKQQDVLTWIRANACDPVDTMKQIAGYLDEVHDRYHLTIVSDNPAYDLGKLDHALSRFAVRSLPCRYTKDDGYRYVEDSAYIKTNYMALSNQIDSLLHSSSREERG